MGRTVKPRTSRVEALKVEGLQAAVEVRRHPSARRMTLRVSRTKHAVLMTVPVHCSLAEAGNFLHTHLDWVRRHLGAVPEPVALEDGAVVPFRGRQHRITFTGARDAAFVVRVEEATGNGMPKLVVGSTEEAGARRLATWLKQQAMADIDKRVQHHAKRLGLRPKKIVVRDQSSRWGSCSTTRVLSFSWRLILAPPKVLDYVAAHEVAHLAQMNHGPKFWALVKKTMPGMDEARAWLRVYGMDLHRYHRP
jgi:predicted metal-dependent hydrolase